MDSKSEKERRIAEVTDALNIISKFGSSIMKECEEYLSIGWMEFNVGDTVYFKTYNDVDDVIMVTKGTIVEIIRRDVKVDNRPGSEALEGGWHTETSVSYKVQWNGGKSTINARYVYGDKLYATLAAITETVNSYLNI